MTSWSPEAGTSYPWIWYHWLLHKVSILYTCHTTSKSFLIFCLSQVNGSLYKWSADQWWIIFRSPLHSIVPYKKDHIEEVRSEAESKKNTGYRIGKDPMLDLTKTSPYVDNTVGSITCTMGYLCHAESTLSPSQGLRICLSSIDTIRIVMYLRKYLQQDKSLLYADDDIQFRRCAMAHWLKEITSRH
jgi:hypothetical protein